MNSKFLLIGIIITHLFIVGKLTFFPYPELFVYPYLAENGFLPYRQIFDQHLPSFLMSPLNFTDFGFTTADSFRILQLVVLAFTHLILFKISLLLFKKRKLILIPNLFYLLLQPLFDGNIFWIDSLISPILLISLLSALIFIEKKFLVNAFLTGLGVGFSIFFKLTFILLLPALAFIFLSKTRSYKGVIMFLVGGMIFLFFTLIWIIKRDLLNEFFYWNFQFNFEIYRQMAFKLPTLSQIIRLFLYFFPIILVTRHVFDKKIMLLTCFFIISCLLVVPRFEFIHFQPALAFAILLLVILLTKTNLFFQKIYLIIFILITFIWSIHFYRSHKGNLVYFFDSQTWEIAQKVSQFTAENDRIFILGAQPTIYVLAERLPAGFVYSANLPWNMIIIEGKLLNSIIKDKPRIIVRDSTANIDGKRVIKFSSKINKYIDLNYTEIDKIGNNEILEIKK